MHTEIHTQVVILGGGPGGYSAAFRCADLGLKTILVERYTTLGGVCLNVGCIPSKALLHVAKVIKEAKNLNKNNIIFGELQTNFNQLREWKCKIVNKLTSGLYDMAKVRDVKVVNGYGKFASANTLLVKKNNDITSISFENAIIAAGSSSIQLPFISHNDSRIWNSTDALALNFIPKNLLIIGGGIIGLEMATIYKALGSNIDIVETFDQVIPLADNDIVNVFYKHVDSDFNFKMKTKVVSIKIEKEGIYVDIEGENSSLETIKYDAILIAIGRSPNSKLLDIHHTGIEIDNSGFIIVDKQMRTNIPHIYAIGDIVGQPMLAHKGIHEGHIAAEVIAGKNYYFDPKVIPYISYTEPEIAWVGLTEKEAKNKGIDYKIAIFPWSASGRAISSNCYNGMTKLIFDKNNNKLIGGSVVGTNAGELLGEISLAIEMDCDAQDIALTIHAHPTLYESIGLAAEVYEGTITDLLNVKKENKKNINRI